MKDLVFVLPLRNRPQYFARFLNYIAPLHADGKLPPCLFAVLDGSDSVGSHAQMVHAAQRNNLPLDYRYCGPDSTYDAYLGKMIAGLREYADSPTAIICDDDFYDFAVFSQMAKLLSQDLNVAAVACHIHDFSVKSEDRERVYGRFVASAEGSSCSGRYRDLADVTGRPSKRLADFARVWPTESVASADTFRAAFERAKSGGGSNYLSYLTALRLEILLRGEFRTIARVGILRQDNTSYHEGTELIARFPTPLSYWMDRPSQVFETRLAWETASQSDLYGLPRETMLELLGNYFADRVSAAAVLHRETALLASPKRHKVFARLGSSLMTRRVVGGISLGFEWARLALRRAALPTSSLGAETLATGASWDSEEFISREFLRNVRDVLLSAAAGPQFVQPEKR